MCIATPSFFLYTEAMFVSLNGRIVDYRSAKISIFDHGFLYGDGVYETMRTYRGKVFQMEEHLDRLWKSAEILRMSLLWEKPQIADWIQEIILKNKYPESRVRVALTRGESLSFGAKFDPTDVAEPALLIAVYPLPVWIPHAPVDHADVVTFVGERLYPEVKSLNMMTNVLARLAATDAGAYEA